MKEKKRRIVYIERLRTKIIVFIISLIVDGLIILIFFLDSSLAWGAEEITSCILMCLYVLLLVPTGRYFFIRLKRRDLFVGQRFIYYRLIWCAIQIAVLLAPYYAVIYYFEY